MNNDQELYDRFVAYLRSFAVGAEHAQTAVTICAGLGMEPTENNRRQLRACANQASHCGELICSGRDGYYVPRSMAEVLPSTRRWRADAGELKSRADRMEDIARRTFAPPVRPALLALMEAS